MYGFFIIFMYFSSEYAIILLRKQSESVRPPPSHVKVTFTWILLSLKMSKAYVVAKSGNYGTYMGKVRLMGKNLKKWKMWKTYILWYLCQNSFKCEFNTPHIVKVDSGLVLFSSFFPFQLTLRLKKSFCVFWQFCRKKVV